MLDLSFIFYQIEKRVTSNFTFFLILIDELESVTISNTIKKVFKRHCFGSLMVEEFELINCLFLI